MMQTLREKIKFSQTYKGLTYIYEIWLKAYSGKRFPTLQEIEADPLAYVQYMVADYPYLSETEQTIISMIQSIAKCRI